MLYDFDTFPPRRGTNSDKWDRYPEDVLPMWVADMDFLSPPAVIQALQERVNHGIFGYINDDPALLRAIVEWVGNHYHWQIRPEELVFLPGVIVGFNLASHMVAAPQGNVLMQTPVYPPILRAGKVAGMTRKEVVLTQESDGSYSIDFEAFEAAITPRTRLFILCNPHNPVGRVFRRHELERMAEICLRHNVLICSDEIHSDFIFRGYQHIPIASLHPEIAQHTITLMAPSKTFNIAGLKLSFAIIQNPTLREAYQVAQRGLVSEPNLLGWQAALAAYQHGEEWLRHLLTYLEANRDFLVEYVRKELPQIKMVKPESTFLAWLDCRSAGIEGSPYEFFLKEARVALNDGVNFGRGGEGFVRLNFGCPRALLGEGLERMKRALERVSSGQVSPVG